MSSTGKHTQPVSGFSPLNFGGCRLWLDATSSSNFALTGTNITTWYDKSPFSNHASNVAGGSPVLSNASINGRASVFFSNAPSIGGSLDLSNRGVAGFMVIRPLVTSRGSDQRIFSAAITGQGDWSAASRFLVGVQQNTTQIWYNRYNASIPKTNFNASNNYIISWTYDGSANSLYLNGANADVAQDVAMTETFGSTLYRLGNQVNVTTETYNGFIGEVIVYDDFLSPAYRQAVEGYLAWKWGIEPDLGTTFSPLTSLSNCAVWFDGADSTAFTLSGSNITQWRDKAGSNVTSNIGTPVYVSNAVGGVPGVRLDVNSGFKISPMSNGANTTTVSIYGVVAASNTMQSNARIFTSGRVADGQVDNDSTATYAWTLYQASSATPTLVFGHASSTINASNTLSNGVPCLISAVFSGTTVNLWANGSNQGSINTTNTLTFDRLGIGKNTNPDAGTASNAWAGNVGEFLVFYAAHTEAQRLQVESYLASKWNIQTRAPQNLVPTHSYAKTVPFLRDFIPTDIPGCALWMDVGDRSTLTLSASNTVTGWTDKSGNRRPLTVNSAGTYSATGFNGLPTIQFVNGQWMTTSTAAVLSNSCSMFIVQQTGASTYLMPLAAGGNTNPYVFWWRGDFNSYSFMQEGVGGMGNKYYATTGVPMIMSGIVTPNAGNYWAFYLNGTYLVNPDLGGFNTAPLSNTGGSNVYIPGNLVQFGGPSGGGFTGNISEVLIFSNALTNAQRLLIENYLATKWGLRGYMQGAEAHPFRYGPSVGTTPADVSGCRLWLDAADASSYTLSGSNLTAITDKSPLAWALGTPTNFTVNSTKFNTTYPSFFATGTGQLGVNTSFTLAQPLTVYFAGQATTANSSTFLFDGTTSDRVVIYQGATMFAGGSEFSPTNIGASTSSHVISAVYNGSSSSMRLNGTTTTGTVGSTGFGGIRVSGRNTGGDGYAGHICELAIFSGAHTTAQRQQIEGYLAWKWGIPFRLPGGSTNTAALYKTLTSEFDPRSVGGCAVWFDALDSKTIQFASGSNIARWLDKSGFQNHLATNSSNQSFWPVYTQNTLNGGPVVTFSNAAMIGGYASPTSTTPHTIFVVARPSAITGFHDLFQVSSFPDGGTTGVGVNLSASYTSNKWFAGSLYGEKDGDVTSNTVASTSRTDIVVGTVWPGSNINTTVNGTTGLDSGQVTSSLNTKANGARTNMGAHWYPPENYYREFYFGYIAEVLAFSKALTVADRQRIEGYLAWKWGLQSQLPALHPYSNVKF